MFKPSVLTDFINEKPIFLATKIFWKLLTNTAKSTSIKDETFNLKNKKKNEYTSKKLYKSLVYATNTLEKILCKATRDNNTKSNPFKKLLYQALWKPTNPFPVIKYNKNTEKATKQILTQTSSVIAWKEL